MHERDLTYVHDANLRSPSKDCINKKSGDRVVRRKYVNEGKKYATQEANAQL